MFDPIASWTSARIIQTYKASNQLSVWSVYLIRCRQGELYTGIATDVARRLKEHEAGHPKGAKFLRGRGPLRLVFQEPIGAQGVATRVERRIKALAKSEKEGLVSRDSAVARLVGIPKPRSGGRTRRDAAQAGRKK